MGERSYFGNDFFNFFLELQANNNQEWFAANKRRYERLVKASCLRFIEDFGSYLYQISPHFTADPRPVGGSMFRIHRDLRFSKDKRPYKTHAGIQFRHVRGKDVHAPGFYLHLAPGEVYAGAGIWQPDSKTLAKIRTAIDENPEAWIAVKRDKALEKHFTFGGESLKRAPMGIEPDHPLIEDLKRKDFVVSRELTEAEAGSSDFIDKVADIYQATSTVVRFLTRAVGLPF